MDKGSFFWSILELGFCSVRECQFFSDGGQLHILLDREHVASIPTWNQHKHACMTHRNPFLMHGFHSMPRVGIQQVSLKARRRWDSRCRRMMIIARIDEPSTPLDLGDRDRARGGPLPWVHVQGIIFWSILESRVLLSKGMSIF